MINQIRWEDPRASCSNQEGYVCHIHPYMPIGSIQDGSNAMLVRWYVILPSLDTCKLSLSIEESNCIHSIVNLEHASSIFRSHVRRRGPRGSCAMNPSILTLADATREDHRGLPTYLIPRSGVLETWHLVGLYRMTLMFKMLRSYWPLPVLDTLVLRNL